MQTSHAFLGDVFDDDRYIRERSRSGRIEIADLLSSQYFDVHGEPPELPGMRIFRAVI